MREVNLRLWIGILKRGHFKKQDSFSENYKIPKKIQGVGKLHERENPG